MSRQPSIFDPPPIERTKPALEGELTLKNGAAYRWALHPERISAEWTDQSQPPGWAFGLQALRGDAWRPAYDASRVIEAWKKVLETEPAVRAVIDEITNHGGHP